LRQFIIKSWRAVFLLALVLLTACAGRETKIEVESSGDPALMQRGKYLVQGLAACGFCHGESTLPGAPLSGGRIISDVYGEISAPNITPHSTGIGSASVEDLVRVFRQAQGVDGRAMSPWFHRGFEWLSSSDLNAIVTFIRSQPPVENYVPKREIGFVSRNTTGLFQQTPPQVNGYVSHVPGRDRAVYGRYIVDNVARCSGCHNTSPGILTDPKYLGGGDSITFGGTSKVAPAIHGAQASGIGGWSAGSIVASLQTGRTPDQRLIDPNYCPIQHYAYAAQSDLLAVAQFLKSVSE